MSSQNHPNKESVANCQICGKKLCEDSIINFAGKNYCESCINNLIGLELSNIVKKTRNSEIQEKSVSNQSSSIEKQIQTPAIENEKPIFIKKEQEIPSQDSQSINDMDDSGYKNIYDNNGLDNGVHRFENLSTVQPNKEIEEKYEKYLEDLYFDENPESLNGKIIGDVDKEKDFKLSGNDSRKKVIEVNNVSVRFNLRKQGKLSMKNYFKSLKNKELMFQEFWALKNITFDVEKGDRLAILGINGAGKSTLLKTIAGVMKPSIGTVETKGKVVPLLELSSGFDRRYTGRENIFLRGATLGFSTKYMEGKFDEIVDFAEIKKFLNVPVANYSSGMRTRLGFSISTMVDPDILILDEVLSVGDAKFRKKSFKKMMNLIDDRDTTVLFVSHSLSQVKKLCNKAILLENGKMAMKGDVEEVAEIYEEIVNK